MGVFRIRNRIGNRQFIAASTNLTDTWILNRIELIAGTHRNAWLQRDWNDFGEMNFIFEILCEINVRDGEQINYGKEAGMLAALFVENLKMSGENGYH
jgi:hypothetical protein